MIFFQFFVNRTGMLALVPQIRIFPKPPKYILIPIVALALVTLVLSTIALYV